MEYLCPLCNGLDQPEVRCRRCGEIMENCGAIQEYYDDYSPYLDMHVTRMIDGVSGDQCLHVFFCKGCNGIRSVAVNLVEY